MSFSSDLENSFRANANRELALPMENYMKNNFSFLGIKTDERRALMMQAYTINKAEVNANYREICWELFNKKEREFHICAIDLLQKEIKRKKEPRDSKTRWKQPVTKKMTQKSTFRQKKNCV